ncbi:putative oxidoreductase ORF334 [Glandiceps talaboti]
MNTTGTFDINRKRLKSPSPQNWKPLPAKCREFKTLRWGVLYDESIGINKHFLQALKNCPRSQLVAIACRNYEVGQTLAEVWEVEKVHDSYDDVLIDSNVDGVYIAVTNSLHAYYAKKAAEHSKHCLVEKPIATKLSDLIELEELAKQNRVVIVEGYPHLYHSQYHAIKQEILSGCIGEVSYMYGNFDFQTNDNGHDVIEREGCDKGALWNIGCYPISTMVALMGECPRRVSAIQQKGLSGEDAKLIGWLKFDDNVMGSISTSLGCPTNTYFEIVGTKGRMKLHNDWCFHPDSWDRTNSFELIMDGEPSKEVTVLSQNVFRQQILSFEATVLDGKAAVVTLATSKKIVATIEAMYKSADVEGVPMEPKLTDPS